MCYERIYVGRLGNGVKNSIPLANLSINTFFHDISPYLLLYPLAPLSLSFLLLFYNFWYTSIPQFPSNLKLVPSTALFEVYLFFSVTIFAKPFPNITPSLPHSLSLAHHSTHRVSYLCCPVEKPCNVYLN